MWAMIEKLRMWFIGRDCIAAEPQVRVWSDGCRVFCVGLRRAVSGGVDRGAYS
jgi:hypothetical protein